MTVFLYYLLGALITALAVIEFSRFVDRCPPERMHKDDWEALAIMVLCWPISWAVFIAIGIFVYMPKALVKERYLFKQPENDNA